MFKLCNSVRIETEHRHFYQKDVSLRQKSNSFTQHVRTFKEATKVNRKQRLQPHQQSYLCRSEEGKRKPSRKGLQLSNKGSQKTIQHKQLTIDIGAQDPQLSIIQAPLTTKTVHNNLTNIFFNNSMQTPKAHHQYGKNQKTTTVHKPHPVILKHKQSQSTDLDKSLEQIQRKSNKAKPCAKPNIETYWQIKKEDIVNNNSDFNTLRKTIKKQPLFQRRDSELTASKSYSRCHKTDSIPQNLKRPHIFGQNNLKIEINRVENKQLQKNIEPQSPSKITKMLQDAKSIESRQPDSIPIQDCLFQESVLIERDIDMFQFITPIAGITGCDLSRAVDRRQGNVVTLKCFKQEQQKQCHYERDILQIVEGLGNQEFPLKLLKFKETLIEDYPEKQIIFVFQSFQRLLSEQILLISARSQDIGLFIDNFINQVKVMLLLLSINGFILTKPLKLEDFVYLDHDWRMHNLSKFKVKMGEEEGGKHLSGWLQQLRDECCHLSSFNN